MLALIFVTIPIWPLIAYLYYLYRKSLDVPFQYPPPPIQPFSAAEYLARMERAQLDICEAKKPIDRTIILWWGLDGLRLNEDGDLEWISRKKPAPQIPDYADAQASIIPGYLPAQTINYYPLYGYPQACMINQMQNQMQNSLTLQNLNTCCNTSLYGRF